MYFLDAVRVLRRRWVVVVVGLMFLAGAGAAVVRYVPTEYQASGQLILLLPPTVDEELGPVNPYLNLPSELTTTASLLAGGIMTKDAQRAVEGAGFDSEYDVAVVPGAGPLLVITSKDTNPAEALATRDAVMDRLEDELLAIQDEVGVPDRQLISATPSSVGEVAEALPGSKIRALAGVLGVGVTLTVLMAFLVDRRRLRPASRKTSGESSDAETTQPVG